MISLIHSESLRSEGEEACGQEGEDGEDNGRGGDCSSYRLHKGTAFCFTVSVIMASTLKKQNAQEVLVKRTYFRDSKAQTQPK